MFPNIFKDLTSIPSTFPTTTAYHDSAEESESDVGDGDVLTRTNAFGEPKNN